MRELLKRLPLAEELLRRNPLVYSRFRRLLDDAASMSAVERKDFLVHAVQRNLASAAALPGYRDCAGLSLEAYPVLTKERLQLNAGDYVGQRLLSVSASTGGSSGRPLNLLRSSRSVVIEQATIDWLAAKAAVDLARCRIAVLRGDIIKDPNDQQAPFWRRFGKRRLIFSSIHLSPTNYRAFAAELEAYRPDVILAYPSSLELLASLAEEHGSRLKFALAITSSEMLRPGLRRRVAAIFGAQLLDHYGMAERVSAAWSLEDGVYHFVFPYGVSELVADDDASGTAGDCGGTARYRILGTTLWNSVQPLIRYDTGDIALLPPGSPDMEAIRLGLKPFLGIEGRASDVLQLANGSRVYALGQVPRGIAGVATVQFLQQASDLVQIIVVPGKDYGPATLEAITRNFYQKVPKSVRIAFELRDTPFRLPNGKMPVFLSASPGDSPRA